jgi:hypothetical protein
MYGKMFEPLAACRNDLKNSCKRKNEGIVKFEGKATSFIQLSLSSSK